jgi:hypothetical protein
LILKDCNGEVALPSHEQSNENAAGKDDKNLLNGIKGSNKEELSKLEKGMSNQLE